LKNAPVDRAVSWNLFFEACNDDIIQREDSMRIGVPKEIKNNEFELVHNGHQVTVETQAGMGAGVTDADYVAAGATISASAEDIFANSDMIVKVKEPLAVERKRLKKGQILFTYLHLAPDAEQTKDLIASGATCIAYETVTAATGGLPLLTPMSEVAGRLAPQVGAHSLEKAAGGRGVLMGGVPGVPAAEVVILGGGVSGTHAAMIALGMGANVTVVDRSAEVLRRISAQFNGAVRTAFSTRDAVQDEAPKLITRAMLKTMKPGSVIVDVAIDQGGCCETSKATTHSDPTYVVDGVIHYCVANMPGAVARTSTFALNNGTLPFALALANKGWKQALIDDKHLRNGLNVHDGKVTCKPVADAQGLSYTSAESILGL